MDRADRRTALVDALHDAHEAMEERLDELKGARELLERPDFVWHVLLQSFATMGSSRGWDGLIDTEANYRRVRYGVLADLDDPQRTEHIESVFRDAGVRFPGQKAEWLADNLDRIEALGGLTAAKDRALAADGRAAKIDFMKRITGIGAKYARNIWMDVYHPDFRDAVAVDQRIQGITDLLGRSFDTYEREERFYLGIAAEAGREGWAVDRLLYNFTDYFEAVVEGEIAPGANLPGTETSE
jgi:hypothetical protein